MSRSESVGLVATLLLRAGLRFAAPFRFIFFLAAGLRTVRFLVVFFFDAGLRTVRFLAVFFFDAFFRTGFRPVGRFRAVFFRAGDFFFLAATSIPPLCSRVTARESVERSVEEKSAPVKGQCSAAALFPADDRPGPREAGARRGRCGLVGCGMIAAITDLLLPTAMFSLMFGMGLTLTAGDFQRVARTPAATVLGTLLQLVGMPMVGIGIALAYGLPPLLAAGLVVIAACPGGMFSNMYVHLARGNTALSVTLTATATMVTLFTLPLWVRGMLSSMGGEAASIEVPVLETALELGGLTVLPVGIGMLVRGRRPEAVKLEKWLTRTAAVVIVGGMAFEGLQRPDLPIEAFQQSLAPAVWLAVAAVAAGIAIPALLRLPTRDVATIAVELVVKNALLGLVLARRSLEFDAVLPIFAFSLVQTPLGILVLVGWRLLARRDLLEGPARDSASA